MSAMDDDFNTSAALGSLFDLSHALNRASSLGVHAVVRGTRELATLAHVLGLTAPRPNVGGLSPELTERIAALIKERAEARERRDWKRADEIRASIESLGAIIKDTPSGTEWEPRPR
jgi:cysteinyl-tRNA synthetase